MAASPDDSPLPTGTIIQISVSQGGVPKLPIPQAHVTLLGLEGDRRYSRISQNHFPGQSRVYARVLHPGRIQVGDPVRIASSAIADGHPREDRIDP